MYKPYIYINFMIACNNIQLFRKEKNQLFNYHTCIDRGRIKRYMVTYIYVTCDLQGSWCTTKSKWKICIGEERRGGVMNCSVPAGYGHNKFDGRVPSLSTKSHTVVCCSSPQSKHCVRDDRERESTEYWWYMNSEHFMSWYISRLQV